MWEELKRATVSKRNFDRYVKTIPAMIIIIVSKKRGGGGAMSPFQISGRHRLPLPPMPMLTTMVLYTNFIGPSIVRKPPHIHIVQLTSTILNASKSSLKHIELQYS